MSDTPTRQTHVYIGTFREPWGRFWAANCTSFIKCPACGKMMKDFVDLRDHWDEGHFDVPVYRTVEEVVQMRYGGVRDVGQGDPLGSPEEAGHRDTAVRARPAES